MGSLTLWQCSQVGCCWHSLSRFQGFQVGMSMSLVALISTCVHIVRLCIIYACVCVWLYTHGVLYYRPQHPIYSPFFSLATETPTLFLHQAYLAPPFILMRSSIRQKETSAQWENALIIHDYLTIQDLVCAAYVVFLISVRQPHLLMAVLWLLFCIRYLQINTTHNDSVLFTSCWLLYYREKRKKGETPLGWLFFLLVFLLWCEISCSLDMFVVVICFQTCVTSHWYLYC